MALGYRAGQAAQGNTSIAIGYLAGVNNQSTSSIILNASGAVQDASTSGFFVNPVRDGGAIADPTTIDFLCLNTVTNEIQHRIGSGIGAGVVTSVTATANANIAVTGTAQNPTVGVISPLNATLNVGSQNINGTTFDVAATGALTLSGGTTTAVTATTGALTLNTGATLVLNDTSNTVGGAATSTASFLIKINNQSYKILLEGPF